MTTTYNTATGAGRPPLSVHGCMLIALAWTDEPPNLSAPSIVTHGNSLFPTTF